MSDLTINAISTNALWRLEIFTDLANGEIKMLTPVFADGSPDPLRKAQFKSQCIVGIAGRPYPVNFDIPAETLPEALERFSETATKAAAEFVDKLKSAQVRGALLGAHGGPVTH